MDSQDKSEEALRLEALHLFEVKTLKLMISDRDRSFKLINNLVQSNFEEIRSALEEFKLGVSQILAGIQQISVSVNELNDSIQKQRHSIKLMRDHYYRVDENSRISKNEQLNLNREVILLQKNSTIFIDLINNINDIAERLGILSINGSIQAARSGESGKGFAVVTSEMRKLSDNVVDSTTSQKTAIEEILKLINQTGVSQKIVLDRTEDVLSALDVFSGTISEIDEQIDRVAANSEELSATVEEFSATIEQISRNTESIFVMMNSFYLKYAKDMRFGQLVDGAVEKFRSLADNERSLVPAAMKHMKYLYENLTDEDRNNLLAMSRLFVCLGYEDLPDHYKGSVSGKPGYEKARYLCLAGTAGENRLWNKIEDSVGHKIIRLPDDKSKLREMPMLDKVFSSLGVPYEKIINPVKGEETEFIEGYYLEEDAPASPYIPDKKFLDEYGIKSQLSIGGVLPSGTVFVSFLFFKIKLANIQADSLNILAPVMQLCYMPFDEAKRYI